MPWTKANHFKIWATEQTARSTLPLLIRKLVRSVVPSDALVNFPASEQVQRPGFDGVVESTVRHQFVPLGKSIWEMGVDASPASKAEKDFNKRDSSVSESEKNELTFVFVTPREWRKKDEWADAKKETTSWKDILVFDCNDLEHWIELCPAVDIWFSLLNGRRPTGVEDLSQRWLALSECSNKQLTPNVFLCDRKQAIDKLLEWKQSAASSLLLRSDSFEDSLDFLSALSENTRENQVLGDPIVINGIDAWQSLTINKQPLFLVATANLPLSANDITTAVQYGHHVLIVSGKNSGIQCSELVLPRQQVYEVQRSLVDCGFDESTARSIAKASAGSSAIMKRILTRHPQTSFPHWAKEECIDEVSSFSLLGAWLHVDPEPPEQAKQSFFPSNPKIDLLCVEDFTGLSRNEIEKCVGRWSRCDQPLFLQIGSSVLVTSREDAWFLLAGAITKETLDKFEGLATLVLDEDNPAFELESKDRWMANIYGKSHSLSHELRNGIVNTLALMACYPTSHEPHPDIDFKATARRILASVLPENASWQRWATFGRHLTVFAEASPEYLLDQIEEDLKTTSPQISRLFSKSPNPISSSSNHTGLLWALETIAWSPKYLVRVTKVLGRLTQFESALADNYANRPSNSLKEIFNWWLPHTNANIDTRIEAINALLEINEDVGWNLLVRLMPGGHETVSIPTQQPRWRDWAVGWTREEASKTTHIYARKIAELILEQAQLRAERWAGILDGIFRYSPDTTSKAVALLQQIADQTSENEGRVQLWKKLDELIRRHRKFQDAKWSFESELLNRLSAICESLKPKSSVDVHLRIFGFDAYYDNFDRDVDHEIRESEINDKRRNALKDIFAQSGLQGILELAEKCSDPSCVGWLAATEKMVSFNDIEFEQRITENEEWYCRFSDAFVRGCYHVFEEEFLEDQNLNSISAAVATRILLCLPFSRKSWAWIEGNCKKELVDGYWQGCFGTVRTTKSDVDFVVERLLGVGRPFLASDILYMASTKPDEIALVPEQVFQVLEAGLKVKAAPNVRVPTYTLQELIGFLQKADVNVNRLAMVEWGYLKLLDKYTSQVRPSTLFKLVADSPGFFVDLLKMIYRSESERETETRTLSETEKVLYENAHELLDSLSVLPGVDEEGAIDEQEMRQWIEEVRKLGAEADRSEITDSQIGHLLSKYPHQDAAWPPTELCRIIEQVDSARLNRGFELGICNSRGVTTRSPFEGGTLERDLAAKYRAIADGKRNIFPSVAGIFDSLADGFEAEAKRHDVDATRSRLDL